VIQKLFTGSNPKNKHVPSLWFKLYARQPLVLNQDLQDFQNYIGRRRFEREG
jgi:hypothetical protein